VSPWDIKNLPDNTKQFKAALKVSYILRPSLDSMNTLIPIKNESSGCIIVSVPFELIFALKGFNELIHKLHYTLSLS